MNSAIQTPQSIFFPLSPCKLLKTCCALVFVFLFSLVLECCLLLYFLPLIFQVFSMLEAQQSSKTRTSFNPSKLGEAATCTRKANLTSLELPRVLKGSGGRRSEGMRVLAKFSRKFPFTLVQAARNNQNVLSFLFVLDYKQLRVIATCGDHRL